MRYAIPIWIALAFAGILTMQAAGEAAPAVRIAEGPVLLHAHLDQQWGGHTFAYLLEGEQCLFWSATQYNPDGKTWGSLIGQFPKPGSAAAAAVTAIPAPGPALTSMAQPLMLRSNDGYIHVFIGSSQPAGGTDYSPGRIRYFRSAAPEDITQMVERTELIPHVAPYNEFHLRMNAGVSRDGTRAAIVILAISRDGSVPFNTPVIFFGDKQGPDFVFAEPVKYADAMGLFYPQIALTDTGAVLVGQVWDVAERSTTRLLHLDAGGKIVGRKDLPAEADGNYWCLDMRPAADDWSTLALYYNNYPKNRQDCRHEFWTYTPATGNLAKHREIEVPEGQINYGKWIPIAEGRSAFIHNPTMGGFRVYTGNLLGSGEIQTIPLPETDPARLGLAGTAHTFVPNPLQGSMNTPGSAWFATDVIPHKNDPEERVRAALLLYRLEFGD